MPCLPLKVYKVKECRNSALQAHGWRQGLPLGRAPRRSTPKLKTLILNTLRTRARPRAFPKGVGRALYMDWSATVTYVRFTHNCPK